MKNKILAGLLSLAVAIGLWLYVVTFVTTGYEETFYNIPVVLQGETLLEERGLMITSNKKPTVNLKLAGERSNMMNLSSANITVTADLSRIYEPGEHGLTFTPSYPGNVPSNAISVQNRNPERILVTVEKRVTKTVDVTVAYEGALPADLIYDKENIVLDYTSVNISGPESVLAQITQARITVDLDGRNESIEEKFVYTLCDQAGKPVDAALVTTDVEQIGLKLKIKRFKEVKLVLNVVSGGGATEFTSAITIDPATIRVSGSEALLDGMDVLELGSINLGEIEEGFSKAYPIVLPEGVTNESGLTEAKVEISFPNLKTKTLSVTNIQAINVPEGREVDLITKLLEVQLRGPVDMIDKIDESAVTVTVDFTDAAAGSATMKAEINISSTFSGVGAVGTYSVSATLDGSRRG